MRKNIVAGNWKMNTTLPEGLALAKGLNEALKDKELKCKVVIAVPFTHLASIVAAIDTNKIAVAAENCADQESGAYTGEVSADMIASTGAKYVIIGHSERRAYYHETAEILKSKVRMALGYGLSPIFCVGEVLAEREAGKHFEVISAQIADSLFHLSVDQFCRLTIAYEPVWAIGTGKTASAAQIQEIHEHIRQLIIDRYGRGTAFNCSLIYGGSCNGSNAKEIFSNLDVDGGLIGGASLTVDKFMQIIEAF